MKKTFFDPLVHLQREQAPEKQTKNGHVDVMSEAVFCICLNHMTDFMVYAAGALFGKAPEEADVIPAACLYRWYGLCV
jgi:hypothetical protein